LFWKRFQRVFYLVTVAWQVIHPEEAPLLGIVSVLCHEDVIETRILDPRHKLLRSHMPGERKVKS
jgi:hypothetical protein